MNNNLLYLNLQECLTCKIQYIRQVITPALHRKCDKENCNGKLKKTGVRYGQTVPVGPLRRAEEAAKVSDLVIVLGVALIHFCLIARF